MKSGRVIISAPNQDFKLHKSESGRKGKGQESSKNRVNTGIYKTPGMGCTNEGTSEWPARWIQDTRQALAPAFLSPHSFFLYIFPSVISSRANSPSHLTEREIAALGAFGDGCGTQGLHLLAPARSAPNPVSNPTSNPFNFYISSNNCPKSPTPARNCCK